MRDFLCIEVASTYSFQVSPLAKLQAFMFGRLGVVSPTIFVIVLCLGVCFGFRFMLKGGGSKKLRKTELDWVSGTPFRV